MCRCFWSMQLPRIEKESAVYIQIQMQTLLRLFRCLAFFGKNSSEIKGSILKEGKMG